MRVCGKERHGAGFGVIVTHDRVHRQLGVHSLDIPVRARVEIGPANVARVAVIGIGHGAGKVVRVKNMGGTDRAQGADGATQVHVVPGNHESAAAGAEPQDPGTIGVVQTVAGIDRKQPQLVVHRAVE